MSNLLPTQEKIRLHRSYLKRFLSTFSLVVAVSGFIGSAFLIPSYLLVSDRLYLAKKSLEDFKALSRAKGETTSEFFLKELEHRAALLSKTGSDIALSALIEKIILARPDGVYVRSFHYGSREGERTMEIRGDALDRDSLLRFVRVLEGDSVFSRVNLPVSYLIKETNLDFLIELGIKS